MKRPERNILFMCPWTPFGPAGHNPGMPPASRASRPRARGYDACKDLQLSSVLPRSPWTSSAPSGHLPRARSTMLNIFCKLVSFTCHPPMDPFRPSGPLSPCAGTARELRRSCSAEENEPERGMYSAWRRAAIARDRMEGTREHKRSVGAWRPLASRLCAVLLPRPLLSHLAAR